MLWGVPTRSELLFAIIGMGLGALITALMFVIGGRDFGRDVITALILVTTLVVPCISLVVIMREAKRDHDRSSQRLRDLEHDNEWQRRANRSATNKHIGLVWTGRHPRRR